MRKKTIFTMAMAKFLTNRGFEAIGTSPNKNDLKKVVWFFERTPELEAACAEYIAASRAKGSGDKPSVDDQTLAGLFFIGGQPIEAIAKAYGVSEERVNSAIKRRVDQARLIAFAALDDDGQKLYMSAQTDDERNAILSDRILQGVFLFIVARAHITFPQVIQQGRWAIMRKAYYMILCWIGTMRAWMHWRSCNVPYHKTFVLCELVNLREALHLMSAGFVPVEVDYHSNGGHDNFYFRRSSALLMTLHDYNRKIDKAVNDATWEMLEPLYEIPTSQFTPGQGDIAPYAYAPWGNVRERFAYAAWDVDMRKSYIGADTNTRRHMVDAAYQRGYPGEDGAGRGGSKAENAEGQSHRHAV